MSNIMSHIFSWFEGESDYTFAEGKPENDGKLYVFAEEEQGAPIEHVIKNEAPKGMPENLKLTLFALGGAITFGFMAAGFGAGWHFASLAHISIGGHLIPTPPHEYWIGLAASSALGITGSTVAVGVVSARNHLANKKMQKEERAREQAEVSRNFVNAQKNNPWRKE